MMIETLAKRFPQLYLNPEAGVSASPLFQAITKEGQPYRGELSHFRGAPDDRFLRVSTPAGEIDTYSFGLRTDYETAVRCLRDRCEYTEIPADSESALLIGLTDWTKVRAHLEAYRSTGCTDVEKEQRRFLTEREQCTTPLLLLCEGAYRGVSAESAGFSPEKWRRVSGVIRRGAALAGYVCGKKWGDRRNPAWDELLWDCVGILMALHGYDDALAKKLRPGLSRERAVDELEETVCSWGGSDPWKFVTYVYQQTDLYLTQL